MIITVHHEFSHAMAAHRDIVDFFAPRSVESRRQSSNSYRAACSGVQSRRPPTPGGAATARVGKLAFFRISDNLGPKAHLARSDNYANKPRRRREKFGAFFKHFERFQWANQPKFSKGRLRRRFQRGPSAPAGPSYARAASSSATWGAAGAVGAAAGAVQKRKHNGARARSG